MIRLEFALIEAKFDTANFSLFSDDKLQNVSINLTSENGKLFNGYLSFELNTEKFTETEINEVKALVGKEIEKGVILAHLLITKPLGE